MKRTFFILMLSAFVLQAAETAHRVYHAYAVNPHPPVIDGCSNEAIWQNAPLAGDFIQFEPVNAAAPSQPTAFQIAYDAQNLYVLIRAYDSEPDKIVGRVSRRDEDRQSDRVGIFIDSYHDRRTAFEFTVDAAGSKCDALHSEGGSSTDKNWDAVWYVKTGRNDSGWVAEMRIPFSQLRFSDQEEHVWGLEVYRDLHRKKELSIWQPIPKDAAGIVHEFGALAGIRNIAKPHHLELLPYSAAGLHASKIDANNPFSFNRQSNLRAGLDGKIGLASGLTMDFTVNPDFGQVEADPSEVNLTAFETFFQEKRPFFIEGKNIFDYRLMIGNGDLANDMLFYSRRIGRAPQRDLDLNDDEYADVPQNTSILAAAKVSGKTSNGWSIGMIDAVTEDEKADISRSGLRTRETVEPGANYWVGRAQKDFGQGRSSLGVLLTTTHRNIHDPALNVFNRAAYTGGVDFRHQWHNRQYCFDVRTAFSHIRGHRDALLDLQTASTHYFQRPDAGYLTMDSTATTLTGNGGFGYVGKIAGHWQFVLAGFWRSPGLDLNDVGYMRRADQIMELFWVGYYYWTPKWIFRQINVEADQWHMWNFGRETIGLGLEGGLHTQLTNYWGLDVGWNQQGERLNMSALRGGPGLISPARLGFWWQVQSDNRKSWQISFEGFHSQYDDAVSFYKNYSIAVTLKPSRTLTITAAPNYSHSVDDWQYVDTVGSDVHPRYIMANIKQKTLAMVLRLDYCLTPNLTIQYYGQPFVAAGEYSRYKRVTQPRAVRAQDRYRLLSDKELCYDATDEVYRVDENNDGKDDYSFDKPDFNFRQFRSNLVLRWEYRPGSTVYLVWAQGRTGSESAGRFKYDRDLRDLFQVYPENIVMIKFNHWFSL